MSARSSSPAWIPRKRRTAELGLLLVAIAIGSIGVFFGRLIKAAVSRQREILADELRREMSASILRRIDSVVRADLEKALHAPVPAEGAAAPEPKPDAAGGVR